MAICSKDLEEEEEEEEEENRTQAKLQFCVSS
jgi:hypothetical protein